MNQGAAKRWIRQDPISIRLLLIHEPQRDTAAKPSWLLPCSVRGADCATEPPEWICCDTVSSRGLVKEAQLLSEWPGSLSVGLLSAHTQAEDV